MHVKNYGSLHFHSRNMFWTFLKTFLIENPSLKFLYQYRAVSKILWNAWNIYIYTLFDLTCYLLIDLQHQLITVIINPEFVEALFTP